MVRMQWRTIYSRKMVRMQWRTIFRDLGKAVKTSGSDLTSLRDKFNEIDSDGSGQLDAAQDSDGSGQLDAEDLVGSAYPAKNKLHYKEQTCPHAYFTSTGAIWPLGRRNQQDHVRCEMLTYLIACFINLGLLRPNATSKLCFQVALWVLHEVLRELRVSGSKTP